MAYNFYRRARLYEPNQSNSHRLSRSKIDFFLECPRCFYLDQRLGVKRPSMPGFTLNIAVDHLLKKEFDIYRSKKEPHPLMVEHHIDAIPFSHADLETWRYNFTGVSVLHEPTNFTVFGAVDDVWQNSDDELIIVDYKATSKKEDPTLDGRWGGQYKRQMEIYQWLFRENGFKVSDTGYFVYENGDKELPDFRESLHFKTSVLPHVGNTSWIPGVLTQIKECLDSETIPPIGELCEHCPYRESAGKILFTIHKKNKTEDKPKEKEKVKKVDNSKTDSLF
jgi:CRISPR/Cas system-associated exonuclease Cas4 (RecB family)